MPIELIAGICVMSFISLLMTGLSWISSIDKHCRDIDGWVPLTSGFVFILGVLWILVAVQHNKIIDKEIIAKSTTVNNVQCAVFNDDKDSYYYNLNGRFSRTFEDGTKFKLTIYDNGPYNGLYIQYKKELKEIR